MAKAEKTTSGAERKKFSVAIKSSLEVNSKYNVLPEFKQYISKSCFSCQYWGLRNFMTRYEDDRLSNFVSECSIQPGVSTAMFAVCPSHVQSIRFDSVEIK
jgi:hypothetical protein